MENNRFYLKKWTYILPYFVVVWLAKKARKYPLKINNRIYDVVFIRPDVIQVMGMQLLSNEVLN